MIQTPSLDPAKSFAVPVPACASAVPAHGDSLPPSPTHVSATACGHGVTQQTRGSIHVASAVVSVGICWPNFAHLPQTSRPAQLGEAITGLLIDWSDAGG